ncbi:methyl-accepting chemotaxis protein [Rhodovulum kholense]|uniref:Methyl-accepting chemotaxis protein n=1 Tax=Rhodovulum kholense TaxID=453584 RepID=A0A8E2VH30_9RHOB|nr:methyl-accepting chemotaxis protein [Rhodovulum kholense]PTW44485.1 methyl-accepting chemotaxis protein [Rhodovulum kholense]
MSLRFILLFALVPLVLLILLLAGNDLQGLSSNARFEDDMASVAEETDRIGDLVQELQKERGLSAGFTASKGRNFPAELRIQRTETDTALSVFRDKLSVVRTMAPEATESALQALQALQTQRGKIDALDLTVPQLAGYYTGIIDSLLTAATRIRTGKVASATAVLMEAQELVALAKESAGLERAMGATGLGSETFPNEVYRRFMALGARQSALLARAQTVLGRPDFVSTIEASKPAQTIAPMRETIAALPYGGARGDLTAPQWFAASTAWIDRLRAVESDLGQEIGLLAEGNRAQAERAMVVGSIATGVGVLLGILIAVAIADGITRRLRKLTGIMHQFMEGNFEAWVPFIEKKGEIGQMANAIYRFKQLTRAAMRQKEEDEATLNERHQQVVDLVTEGLKALSRSDLSRHFEDPLHGDYDTIRTDFNATVVRLREVLSTIASTVSDLERRSEDMLRTAGDLAQQTSSQSSTIQGTAASVDRLASGLKDTNGSIHDARSLAGDAKQRADLSGEIVRDAVLAMERISESSSKIAQITAMIEDIAFQTNLLALNAGVEAARAGESGKGFAVVATEVRELARRSAESAMQIKKLIGESVEEVSGGVRLVGEAGQSLEEIVSQVTRVYETLAQVSAQADGQTRELQEVNESMTSLRALTERNGHVVDSTRDASNDLAASAQALARIVAEFNLGPDQRGNQVGRAA